MAGGIRRLTVAAAISLCAALLAACAGPAAMTRGSTLSGDPPIIIAHRGLSGEWPEHTLEGYRAAIAAGADYIEPDLVLTKDGVLVARHENDISDTTDVAAHPEFASRRTTKLIDGTSHTGWFTEDFTLAELRTLRAKERLPMLRGTAHDGQFLVPTFDEILALREQASREAGRAIGVYPETKHPSYFAAIGLPHEAPLLAALSAHGLTHASDPVFIQSFEVGNLIALNGKTDVRLIQLVDASGAPADQPDTPYAAMMTEQGLTAIARYADGIGPAKDMIIPRDGDGKLMPSTGLVAAAHAAGLAVHPWTFRRENFFLPADFRHGTSPVEHGDLAAEIRAFIAAGIDGLFTDNTPEASGVIRR